MQSVSPSLQFLGNRTRRNVPPQSHTALRKRLTLGYENLCELFARPNGSRELLRNPAETYSRRPRRNIHGVGGHRGTGDDGESCKLRLVMCRSMTRPFGAAESAVGVVLRDLNLNCHASLEDFRSIVSQMCLRRNIPNANGFRRKSHLFVCFLSLRNSDAIRQTVRLQSSHIYLVVA